MGQLLDKLMVQNIVINEVVENEDSTILKVKMCIMDFKPTPNGWCVQKEVVERCMGTLVNKPIVCKYTPEKNGEYGTDYLGDHEESHTIARDTNGEIAIPRNNTVSIGVITNTYIAPIGENSDEEGLWADGILWLTREYNSVSLIYDWFSQDIKINCSVEWVYMQNDSVTVDGIEYMSNITFTGFCVLNSMATDDKPVIYGNYSMAELKFANNSMIEELNNAIKADIELAINNKLNTNNEVGDDVSDKVNIFKQALNQISFGETRDKIYSALEKTLTAEEYNNMWLGTYGVYDDHIVYETYVDNSWKMFKVSYSKAENDELTVDLGSKVEVGYEYKLVEKQVVNELQTSLNKVQSELDSVSTEKGELEISLNTLKEDVIKDKDMIVELNEAITSLNAKVVELEPFKLKADEEAYQEALNTVKEEYKVKFNKLGAGDIFESEEIQNEIIKCLNSDTKRDAEFTIKSKLCDLITNFNAKVEDKQEPTFVEQPKALNNLKPQSKFKENYGFEV